MVYATWFAGGLRVIDVSDPFTPREAGHFIPEPLGDEPSPQSNDVDVDELPAPGGDAAEDIGKH